MAGRTMNNVSNLIKEAEKQGTRFILENNRVILKAATPLPPILLEDLRNHKTEIQQYLIQSKPIRENNWLDEEWRRINLPCWRRILRESIEQKDTRRAIYARRMLREVLEDPDYKENIL
jgi:hypothetical protein